MFRSLLYAENPPLLNAGCGIIHTGRRCRPDDTCGGETMKIAVLTENTACSPEFRCEHGLSLYMEACGHRMLFDSGQSGLFADNAKILGIDLESVDTAVLSHGHYDHGGGLKRFLEINKTALVYMNVHAFEGHFGGDGRNIGLDPELKESGRIVFVEKERELFDGAVLFPAGGCRLNYPVDSSGLIVERDGVSEPEDFLHEQYLLIEENRRRILISGCSHRGILNIMDRFAPDVLVGGFHFMKVPAEGEGARRLTHAANELMQYQTRYYTGHCTGREQFDLLKKIMGERIEYISAGKVFEL